MARMPDPYSDDDGDDNVDKELATFRGHQQQAEGDADADDADDDPDKPPRQRARTGVELVTVDDDDDAEIDIEPAPRRQQRQERGGIYDAWQGQIAENTRLQGRVSQLEQIAQSIQTPKEDDEDTELQDEIEELEEKQERILSIYNKAGKNLPTEQVEEMQKEARLNDRKLRRLETEQTVKQLGLGQQQSPAAMEQAALRAQFTSNNPDVYGNPAAHALLLARYKIAREVRQEPDSIELHDRCCEEVRDELRMASRRGPGRPTDKQRRQTSGVLRGGTAGGKRGRTSMRMSDEQKQMADIAFSHIKDTKKRHTAWVQSVGASLVRNNEA